MMHFGVFARWSLGFIALKGAAAAAAGRGSPPPPGAGVRQEVGGYVVMSAVCGDNDGNEQKEGGGWASHSYQPPPRARFCGMSRAEWGVRGWGPGGGPWRICVISVRCRSVAWAHRQPLQRFGMRLGEKGVRVVFLCGRGCEVRVRDRDTLRWFRVFDHARKRLGSRASRRGAPFPSRRIRRANGRPSKP